jgi:hypothetical protein
MRSLPFPCTDDAASLMSASRPSKATVRKGMRAVGSLSFVASLVALFYGQEPVAAGLDLIGAGLLLASLFKT